MEVRQALERRFGKEKVHKVVDNPYSDLRCEIPMARVVTVRGSKWQVDYNPRADFTDAGELESFLREVEKVYEGKFHRKLRMKPGEALGASWVYVMLGTRSKMIKNFIESYGMEGLSYDS